MFYLYHHNDLGELAGLFSVLRERNRVAPLASDTVLVPNRGMGRWLTIQLAESNGVAANVDTALPGKYIWQLLNTVDPAHTARGHHFEADALPWHLYFALPAMAASIPAVADYLGTPVDEVRRWQLARQLADVFDKYLVYRADMLTAWTDGATPGDNPGYWQAQVWRYLTAAQQLGNSHRGTALTGFVQRLQRLQRDNGLQQRIVQNCPAALYCFGLVAVAPDHLRLLYALARHIDVHFLLPNPSREYWGDIVSNRLSLQLPNGADDLPLLPGETAIEQDHPLLAALGRMARDTLRVLYSDEFAELIEFELGDIIPYTLPGDDSLLHRIQTGIVQQDCADAAQGMTADDTSFAIHACHSPLREVQVLHDQLLDRLATDDKRVAAGAITASERLAPRDIIVMLPDVAAYAPAIKAVFGGAARDRYLPFGLADRARAATHPIVTCFATLIDLPLSRWQASELLDLLAVPAVMRRFELTAGELDHITHWIDAAGIRWGRDAAHRAALGAGHFGQNTWQFGLDRLLLGVAQADAETLVDGVAPWVDLEGASTMALGKLWRFERTLAASAQELTSAATPRQWQTRLNHLVDALIAPASDARDEQRAVDGLRALFAQLEAAEASANAANTANTANGDADLYPDRTISWAAMHDMLHTQLNSASERQPFLAGGITFCGMVPLRAVPFRLVCILGLNDSAFPREDRGHAFNVMYQQPRLGDRNTRDDDRLLFLQALTAAREAFYLSYIGQDVHTGETLQPSPVVAETLEFIQHHYFRDQPHDASRARLVHQQPMQPFSARYFAAGQPDARVFTFAGTWRGATHAAANARSAQTPFLDAATATPEEAITAIDLVTLKRFFDHPPRAFFRDRVKLDLEIADQTIADEEPITLDALTTAQLRQRLFDSADATHVSAIDLAPSAIELARGMLPPRPLADACYTAAAEAMNTLLPTWQAWQAEGPADSVDIDLVDVDGVRISGRVGQVWPQAMRCMRTGKLKTKHRMRYWIDYLAAVAAGHELALQLAGFTPKPGSMAFARFDGQLEPTAARAELAKLVRIYIDGQSRPCHYHPDLADAYNAEQSKGFDSLGFRFKSSAYANNRHHLYDDVYFKLLLGDDAAPLGANEADSPFVQAIDAITEPLNATIVPRTEEPAA